MTTNNTYTPLLRFPEFKQTGSWILTPLYKLLEYERPDNYTVDSTNYYSKGIPVLTANKSFVLGYTKENYNVYTNVPIIIFDDFTTDKKYVDFPFKVKSSAIKILKLKEGNLRFIYELMTQIKFNAREHKRYYISEYQNINIPIPPTIKDKHLEQQKIAECLSSLADYIYATQEKLQFLQEHKKGLLQQLFPTQGKTTPLLRFPEFVKDGVWKSDTIDTICVMRNGYTPSKANDDYWTNGTIPWFRMEDIRKNGHILADAIQHITPEAVKGNGLFSAYSIILATTATIGEHALLIADSLANQQFTNLKIRKSHKNIVDVFYFHYYMFIVDEWCKRNTNSGGLLSVNMNSLKNLQIPYPPTLAEQQKIAGCFANIDDQISTLQNKLNLLQEHKQGLMQQLFPQI